MTKKDKPIKATWIVCSMENFPLCNAGGITIEHRTERAALRAAKAHINESEDSEAWVFKLSHVASRPPVDPIVDVVK